MTPAANRPARRARARAQAQVKSSSLGAMFKATESTDFHDGNFRANAAAADAAGLRWGAYHFLRCGRGLGW